jgi:hypothetical protein
MSHARRKPITETQKRLILAMARHGSLVTVPNRRNKSGVRLAWAEMGEPTRSLTTTVAALVRRGLMGYQHSGDVWTIGQVTTLTVAGDAAADVLAAIP